MQQSGFDVKDRGLDLVRGGQALPDGSFMTHHCVSVGARMFRKTSDIGASCHGTASAQQHTWGRV